MQKIYDTISHEIIKKRFNQLLNRAKSEKRISRYFAGMVKRWFFYYVDCFDFINNVLINNKKQTDDSFWKNIKGREKYRCKIEWVDRHLLDRKQAKRIKGRVGVPQGGALSGLIANIVMHFVDEKVLESIGKKDMLYCRFCDDMILIGPDENNVINTFTIYNTAIRISKLVAHPNKPIDLTQMKFFSIGKSRGRYNWM